MNIRRLKGCQHCDLCLKITIKGPHHGIARHPTDQILTVRLYFKATLELSVIYDNAFPSVYSCMDIESLQWIMAAKGITPKFLRLSKQLNSSAMTRARANELNSMKFYYWTLDQAMHRSSLVLVGDFVLVSDHAYADHTVLLGSDYRKRQKLL